MRIILIIALLSGCATTSNIQPHGKGSYIIGAEDVWGVSSSSNLKIKAITAANEFCGKQGKIAEITNTNQNGNIWTGTSSDLIFSCVDK